MRISEKMSIWTDGGARGNPGPAGIGFKIDRDVEGQSSVVAQEGRFIGIATNNQAEYRALLEALDWLIGYCSAHKINPSAVELQLTTDSELMAYQLSGRYKVKNSDLITLYNEVNNRLTNFAGFNIKPVRREYNQVADRLVNQAIDSAKVARP